MFEEEDQNWFEAYPTEDQYMLEQSSEESADAWWDEFEVDTSSQTPAELSYPLNFPDEPGLSQEEIDASNKQSLRNQELNSLREQADPTDRLWVPEAIGGGVYNAVRDTGMALSAGAEEITDSMGYDILDGMTSWLNETFPKYEPEDDSRKQVLSGLTSAGVGVGLGAVGTARALAKVAPNLGKIKKAVGVLLGGEVGATVTAGSEEALLFNVLGQDQEGEFSENVLRQRVDFLADSIAISGILGGSLSAAGMGSRYVKDNVLKPIWNWRNLEAKEKEFVGVITDIASGINPQTASREEIQRSRQEILDYLNENQETLIKLADKKVDDPSFVRDTSSLLSERPGMERSTAREVEELRSAALKGGSPKLEEALEIPERTLSSTVDDVIKSRGGAERVQETGDQIIRSGVDEVSAARQPIRDTESAIARAERGIEESIRNDPTFAPILKELGDKVSINLDEVARKPANEMVENIMEASRIMTTRKNELYDAIPDTAHVNTASLNEVIEPAIQSGALSDNLVSKLDEAGDNFKELNRFANFDLQPEIKRLYDNNEVERARQLIELRRNIVDDQLDYLAIQGDDVTREAAEQARNYYKNEYSPFWRDNPVLEEIQNISRTAYSPTERVAQSRVELTRQLENTDIPERTDNIIDLLSRKEAGESTGLAVDYTLGKIANNVRSIINRDGKLTPENSTQLIEQMNRFGPILDKVDPAKRVQIEEFFTKLRDENFNVSELRTQLKQFEDNAQAVKDRVFNDELKEFFQDGKGVPNSQAALGKLFSSEQGENRLRGVIQRVQDNPLAMEGLEAAWAKEAQKKWFTGKDNTVSVISRDDQFYKNGKLIYGEEAMNNVVDGLNSLAELTQKAQRANITRGAGGPNYRAPQEKTRMAVNMVLTWMFGVLNPTAARVRTVSGDLMKTYNSTELSKRAGDIILADPKRFSEVLQSVIKSGEQTLTPREKQILRQSMFKAGYVLDDDDPLDTQTEDVLNISE